MKKNQTLKANGVEVLLFPMEHLRITQGVNGQYSHKGTNAIDCGGKDAGIDPIFAPCTMKHVWRDSEKNGNAVFFESVNKVLFADGTIDYATLMFIHDNYIGDYKVGQTFKQGQEFGDEGTAGRATGNHTHIEVAKGRYTKPYVKNKYGVWMLPNSVHPNKAFHINDTVNLQDMGYGFKTFTEKTIKVGANVRIKANAAKYATGQSIPQWVKAKTHTVQQVKSDRVLLKEIMSWVYINDVTL